MIIHGGAGVGKSSLVSHAPDVVFLPSPGENGIDTLMSAGLAQGVAVLPEVKQWEMATDIIEELTVKDHGFKTLAVDVFTGLDPVCEEFVVRTEFGGERGAGGYGSFGAGERAKFSAWNRFLAQLDKLREAKRMRLVLLGHTKVGNKKNPLGLDYGRFIPEMSDKLWDRTFGWCDICLFANFYTEVSAESKGATKGKAKGGSQRVMYTTNAAGYDAKNRHGLPEEIDMGSSSKEAWENLVAAMVAAKQATKGAVE